MNGRWFKVHGGAVLLSDDLDELTPAEECAWWRLLCVVSLDDEPGTTRISNGLARKLRLKNRRDVERFMAKLAGLGMVELEGETVVVTNWSRYQERNRPPSWGPEASRERQQRSRARRRDVSQPVTTLSQPEIVTVTTDVTENVTTEEEKRREREEGEGEESCDTSSSSASDRELSEVDLAVGRLCREWERATGTTVTPMLADALGGHLDEGVPEDWLADAIRETGAQGKKAWRYTAAILANWKADGRRGPPESESPQDRQAYSQMFAKWQAETKAHIARHKCGSGCASLAVGTFSWWREQQQQAKVAVG